ncbi:MAG: histidine kinase dimerization/phosphoacceptor domain -containing protein [Candidatus Competibacteraceae bacterium]
MKRHTSADLAEEVLANLAVLFEPPPENMVCVQQNVPIEGEHGSCGCLVVGATGRHTRHIGQPLHNLLDPRIVGAIRNCIAQSQHLFDTDCTVLTLNVVPHQETIIFIDSGRVPDGLKPPLLDVLVANFAACFRNAKLVEDLVRTRRQIERQHTFLRTVIDADPHYIYVKDRQGRIRLANRSLASRFGLTPEQLVGRTLSGLITDAACLQSLAEGDTEILSATQPVIEREMKFTEQTGQPRWLFNVKAPIRNESHEVEQLLGIGIDITERKLLEERLNSSLHEKEVLLKEIHHRVKNNLQVVVSLLDLQADYIEDPVARSQFLQSSDRVRSMALIHEQLYQSPSLARIDFADYIGRLVGNLFQFYASSEREITPRITVIPEGQTLSVETAVPCGLIINELIINAMKHAFVSREAGQVSITLEAAAQQFTLRIKDDGVGFPDTVNFRQTASLGMMIVMSLVTQLQGNIELQTHGGTEFVITFPNPSNAVGT